MVGFEPDQRRYSEAHYGAPSFLMSIVDPEIGNGSLIAAGSFESGRSRPARSRAPVGHVPPAVGMTRRPRRRIGK